MKAAFCSASILVVLVTAPSPAAAAVDSFYRNRMEAGVQAFAAGDWPAAARQLRIACFGYLEEPVGLAAGLIRLAIAQAEMGDDEGVRTVFLRLIQLEERYSAYSEAKVPAQVRKRFERHSARRVPLATLRFAAGFQAIAEQAEMVEMARLPVERRRATLERRLAAEPDRAALLVEMARLELQLGRPRVAFEWLRRLPAEHQAAPPAICLLQQAAAESRDCALLEAGMPFCDGVPTTIVEFSLQCLADEGRWSEAADLLAGLPTGDQRSRRLTRLEKRIRRNQPAPGGDDEPANVATANDLQEQPPASEPPDAMVAERDELGDEPPAVDPEAFERLRRQLATAVTPDQLTELFTVVEDLADRQPAARRIQLLAAEIAYLRSDWPGSIFHFRRAGDLHVGEESLAFYFAVALYESGERAAAAEILRPVASRLERTSFVETYLDRILAPGI